MVRNSMSTYEFQTLNTHIKKTFYNKFLQLPKLHVQELSRHTEQ
jgi:hypothetical protein